MAKKPAKIKDYNHLAIEKKWQKIWDENKTYKTLTSTTAKGKKPFYILDMFPYPSGAGLHVGHPRGYIGTDVLAHQKRMQGYNVLHPMGYDAFGLPAEQYAITHKVHPKRAVEINVKTFEKQLSAIGLSYDWSRRINTTDPEYYKWTQWIFLQLYNSYYDVKKNKAQSINQLVKIFETKGNKDYIKNGNAHTTYRFVFSGLQWKGFTELKKQEILMHYRLAFEADSEVNWCQELGTVLANDEIVEKDGKQVSERGEYPVEKMTIRQWSMRITAYAERLISGLDTIDFPEHIKTIQNNWIGKSEGAEIDFTVQGSSENITTFTTRADTLFGAFAVIVAPEHDFIEKHKNEIQNYSVVETFVRQVKNKTNEERTDAKNKSGVELKGIKVINPINGELLPVWVADFVLAQYGTGAVFADMHDERDFAFAEKYKLPMKEVLLPNIIDKRNPPVPGKKIVPRQNIHAIVRDPKTGLYLALRWKKFDWTTFPMGGVEEGEDVVTAALREVAEETGFTDLKLVRVLPGQVRAEYFAAHKDQNRVSYTTAVVFELGSNKRIETSQEEKDSHDIIWLDESKLNYENMTHAEVGMWKEKMDPTYVAYTGEGVLINSGKFTGMSTEVARNEIIKSAGGRVITNYKMRDAIFARQRYWGEPIPLFRDKNGIIHVVKKLPLELPNVKSYEPTGKAEGPLAGVKSWTDKGYETNTMPGWAGSSWYFLRYMDPKNAKSLVGEKEIAYWKNVDVYVGGAEHVTGHLLYSRFWHKFLKDIGVVNTEEPFKKMYNQGLILANDGRKMSKRWGNVINPDDIIKTFGADTLRVYEMFMGPFTASQPWNTESIIGSRRFIERVWRLGMKIASTQSNSSGKAQESAEFLRSGRTIFTEGEKGREEIRGPKNSALSEAMTITLHKTIKKVTEDIENFAFNTAISSLMICLNEFESAPAVPVDMFKTFLQLLAPFAPHVTDELWTSFGEKLSIHNSVWPKHNPKKIVSNTVTIGVQVNGKVRAEITIPTDATQADVEVIAMKNEKVIQWLEGKTVQKIIYVPGRLINIAAA